MDHWLIDKKFKCYKKMENIEVTTLDAWNTDNSSENTQRMQISKLEIQGEK